MVVLACQNLAIVRANRDPRISRDLAIFLDHDLRVFRNLAIFLDHDPRVSRNRDLFHDREIYPYLDPYLDRNNDPWSDPVAFWVVLLPAMNDNEF